MRVKLSLLLALLLAGSTAVAQTTTSTGDNSPGLASLPRDQHEGFTIWADCYKNANRGKEKFGKANPLVVGILPVEIFLKNDTPQPIRINLDSIQLDLHSESGRHDDIDWLPVEEVAKSIAHPHGPPSPKTSRFPIGVQTGADKKVDQLAELLRPLALDGDVVVPLGTLHGFLFFDLNHDLSLADHASLYVPNVTNIPLKKALMFFEVPLGKDQ